MLSEDNLASILLQEDVQSSVRDYVQDFEKELASRVNIKRYREYPLGDRYYIDYSENDFDESNAEKKFYKNVADYVKDYCCDEIIFEGYTNKEICNLAEFYFRPKKVLDLAYSLN